MTTTTKKTPAEKQLIKFRNQLHNLLIRNPEIRLAGDEAGDILAFISDEEWPKTKVYLPRSGHQELINK
jgi:hypothetical protein